MKKIYILLAILSVMFLTGCKSEISSFSVGGYVGKIDQTYNIITVTVPYGTNVTAMVASFSKSGTAVMVGSEVQKSGSTINNFTNTVIYRVIAYDTPDRNYRVTVTVAPAPNPLLVVSAQIGTAGGTVEVTNSESPMFHAKVAIPSGALDKSTTISLTKVDQAVALPEGTVEGGVVIDFGPHGTISSKNKAFTTNILFTLPYDDADNDGIVDYTGVPEGQVSVKYWDFITKSWTNVTNIISRDTVNNTITFEGNNNFTYYSTFVTPASSNSEVFIFVIDGCDLWKSYWSMQPVIPISFPARTGYLRMAILKGFKDAGVALYKNDVLSFAGKDQGQAWNGDATDTSNNLAELIKELNDAKIKAGNKKFIVVTHSWGTQLGTIGLSMSGVEPDLFITLSDPEGSANVVANSYSNYWFLPTLLVSDAKNIVAGVVQIYGVGRYAPIKVYATKWINYWDVGDIISGPLPYADGSLSVTNSPVINSTKRNYDTTNKVHAITSLSEAFWKDNGVSNNVGKAFRDRVVQAIRETGTTSPGDYTSANIGTLKYVPAGSFQRDDTASNISIVSAFRMSQYEITRAQFLAIMGTDPSHTFYSSGTSDPVQRTNWYHAIAFCNKLSIAEGLTPVYSVSGVNFSTLTYAAVPTTSDTNWDAATANWSANGYRLPTEMEWMWAAMGATSDRSNGYTGTGTNTTGYTKGYAGSIEAGDAQANIGDYAWTWENSLVNNKSQPVGTKLPNELGLYDMSGNVWEWCWDLYDDYPDGELASDTDAGRGAPSGTPRVVRGASWYRLASLAMVAIRGGSFPDIQGGDSYTLGFRVVRN